MFFWRKSEANGVAARPPLTYLARIEARDADYGIPRRANESYLPPLQAWLRWLGDAARVAAALVAALGSTAILVAVGIALGCALLGWAILALLWLFTGLVLFYDISRVLLLYAENLRLFSSLGTARWARYEDLAAAGFAAPPHEPLAPGALRLGLVRRGLLRAPGAFVLPPPAVMGGMVFFGPPGAGKSVLLMNYLRQWGQTDGSTIVIDPKGELRRYAGLFYRTVYSIDFTDPQASDRWNFMARCRGNKDYASMIAETIVATGNKHYANIDSFWPTAERALLVCIILFLCEVLDSPQPYHIVEFLQQHTLDEAGRIFTTCARPEIRAEWGNFNKAPEETRGSIFTGAVNLVQGLSLRAVRDICSPVSKTDAQGQVGVIDFKRLRTPGTAFFLVIPEGRAETYKLALSLFFAEAVYALREDDVERVETPVLLVVDEARHVRFAEITEISGVGRARKFALAIFYQNIAQGYDQYGHDEFNAALESILTKTILPGCGKQTVEYFSALLGEMTVDVQIHDDAARGGAGTDRTRHSPQARRLATPDELRRLLKFHQAVTVTDTLPPVKWRVPPSVKDSCTLTVLPHGAPVYLPLPKFDPPLVEAPGAGPEAVITPARERDVASSPPAGAVPGVAPPPPALPGAPPGRPFVDYVKEEIADEQARQIIAARPLFE